MAEVELIWVNEHRYLAIDSSKQHCVLLSPPSDIGVKPSDALLISLASCTAHDTINIIKKQRSVLHQLHIHVTAEQASEPPWKYQNIHLRFDIKADDLKQQQAERAVDLALNHYCSVRASLAPDIPVTFAVVLEGDAAAEE